MYAEAGGGGGYAPSRPRGGKGSSGRKRHYNPPPAPPRRTGSNYSSSPSRSRYSSGGGSSRYSGGGGGGGGGGGYSRPAPPPKPTYSGPPPPSASMIQQLYSQLGDINRQGRQNKADFMRSRSGLQSARTLFLQQLADAYKGRTQETAANFAERGLSQSGLYTEALAQLNKQRASEQSAYQSEYQGNLDQLLAKLTNQRSELGRRRRTLSERYNQARADRARILKLMGA